MTTYTIGGTISGLTGSGLILQDNGGSNLTAAGNGGFTFASPVASGGNYDVTVLTQPSNPAQTCTITKGSGSANANVTTVQVACVTLASVGGTVSGLSGTGLVLQVNGSGNLVVSANGAFQFSLPLGTAYTITVLTQPSNPPQNCVVNNGSGVANGNVTNIQIPCTGEWVWLNGSFVSNQPPNYGTLGTPAPGNVPGARASSFTWVDSVGTFWLFGGLGFDSTGLGTGPLSDLWAYSNGEWTWMGGPTVMSQPGVYGTLGVGSLSNIPGSRSAGVGWKDGSGNFWLYGGYGYDSVGTLGDLSDLWEYSGGEWTWMNGSNLANQQPVYGSVGVASSGNTPGGRDSGAGWIDSTGNLWLFGGDVSQTGNSGSPSSDLWKYSGGEWTWLGGPNVGGQSGIYGTLGTSAPSNVPGGRRKVVSWVDSAGNFWLFGGLGHDAAGTFDDLNDLWSYSNGEWTWMGGSNIVDQPGSYGTVGIAAPTNIPGARDSGIGWVDAGGSLWLFAGSGPKSSGLFNDLWVYSAGEWTWIGGSSAQNQYGSYGTLGIPSPTNVPGAREATVGWIDVQGNPWLFGGDGQDSSKDEHGGLLNDLWEFVR